MNGNRRSMSKMSVVSLALLIVMQLSTGRTEASPSEYVPGEVLVKFKDGTVRTREVMNSLYQSIGVQKIYRFKGGMIGAEQLTFDSSVASVEQVVQQLEQDPLVEYAQPNYILHALPIDDSGVSVSQLAPAPSMPCIIPGLYPPGCEDNTAPAQRPALKAPPADVNPPVADPSLSQAYGIAKIGAPQAWQTTRGSKSMIVAVIDTGIDYNHEDLAFNVWRNPNPKNGDVVGYDFTHNDGLPYDDNKHGTHTSGTVGAVGGNGIGVSGVNQRVSIMALKFLTGQGSGTTADAVKAIDYAVSHGARVLSNSWGGSGDSGNNALKESIERAAKKGVLFVAAAGNESNDNDRSPTYPAAFTVENMVTVVATDSSDRMASFSNYGRTTTHLAAPGVQTYSTTPGNRYESLSGTSMACPHVAGAAALIWSKNPKMTFKQVKAILMESVDKVGSLSGKTISEGRLNVAAALKRVSSME